MTQLKSLCIFLALTTPALAEDAITGDALKGEKEFMKCRSCHSITGPEGAIVKGGKVGPNLYGVIGRQAGSLESFTKYGDDLIAAGAAGLIWDEAKLVGFVENPAGYLSEVLGTSARSKMSFRIKGSENIAAYLASFSAPKEPEDTVSTEDSE